MRYGPRKATGKFHYRNPGWMPGFLFMLLALVPNASAADPQWPKVDADAIRAHVTVLAGDELEGRAPGTRGYELAARYVAEELRLIGLEPAGPDRSWLQPLTLLEATSVLPAARVVLRQGPDSVALAPAADFLPLPSYLSPHAFVDASMVFVGFGVSAPDLGYDDFRGIDLAGKVAVVLDGVPDALPADLRNYFDKQKQRQLAARGAVGIVLVTRPEDSTVEQWNRKLAQVPAGRMRLIGADGRPVDTNPGLEAGIVLSNAAAARLFAGQSKSVNEVWADAGAGRQQSFALHGSITVSTRSKLRLLQSANVVGLIRGSDPTLRHEYVVLTAHLDHFGRGAAINGDDIYNGALDNASGVAVMLETARALATSAPRPKRSILILATTAEEHGLLGSRHFALNPTVPKGSIVAALNIDMPVALYPAAGFTVIGAEHSTLGDQARAALEREGLRDLPNAAPERGLFTLTDQYSFVREGIPSLYLHDGPVASDPDVDAHRVFDDFLARHYHQVSDDLSLPIDWAILAKFAQVYARLCRDVADASSRPSWLPSDFFGGGPGAGKSSE